MHSAAFIDKFDPASGAPPLAWMTSTLQRRCWAINRSRRLDRRAGQWVDRDSGEPRFSVADLPAQTAGVEETVERAEYVLEARAKLGALKPRSCAPSACWPPATHTTRSAR